MLDPALMESIKSRGYRVQAEGSGRYRAFRGDELVCTCMSVSDLREWVALEPLGDRGEPGMLCWENRHPGRVERCRLLSREDCPRRGPGWGIDVGSGDYRWCPLDRLWTGEVAGG